MRKTVITILGTLLIAGSAVQMATAAEHHKVHRARMAASEQFRNANNSIDGHSSAYCANHEAGNPYDERTDYIGWSAWRAEGGWDARNDCW